MWSECFNLFDRDRNSGVFYLETQLVFPALENLIEAYRKQTISPSPIFGLFVSFGCQAVRGYDQVQPLGSSFLHYKGFGKLKKNITVLIIMIGKEIDQDNVIADKEQFENVMFRIYIFSGYESKPIKGLSNKIFDLSYFRLLRSPQALIVCLKGSVSRDF